MVFLHSFCKGWAKGKGTSLEPRLEYYLCCVVLGKTVNILDRGVQPAAQDGYECGPTQNRKFP